ncbi:uncharacterized protein CC84DRAFT_1207476 [Paraphaeosphaeria sporulosa]|uniref:Rhodopsin domain-containing protein n=1 Tax=Paraphaeosphaeria sporulosa TaxID=1460663 RepID=A0A177C6S9_9PLEO|nr:uncharacterized protein CC84DRAFT_1207476 [Paraphaeosphaeria sporulosa]OAG02579.1 hypothetical protein CC84DRAFT_1207476 [Paraphaeosphaeria sporulosa]
MSAPAAQYSPQYLNEGHGPTIIATASLMIILCTVFVGLRYYARYLTSTHSGAEDVIIPFALLAEVGLCVVGILMVKEAGTGRHLAFNIQRDPDSFTKHFKGIIVNEFLHPAAVAFPKLVVVILYLRVFTNKLERGVAWGLFGVIIATFISFFVATCVQCTPFAYSWDKSIPGGRCFDTVAFAYSSSVPNIVTDLISTVRKTGLMLIFLTGSVGIIASVVRTVVFAKTNILDDITFTNVPLINWTIIEPGFYLLAACALSFKPLFRMVAKALHLGSVLTHTKSALNKTSLHKTNQAQQKDIHMETFKSGSSGGFTKLSDSADGEGNDADGRDRDHAVWFTKSPGHKKGMSDGALSVVVTRTIEIQSEDLESGPQVRTRDHVHYNTKVSRAE